MDDESDDVLKPKTRIVVIFFAFNRKEMMKG
jgi:hypothetical protein